MKGMYQSLITSMLACSLSHGCERGSEVSGRVIRDGNLTGVLVLLCCRTLEFYHSSCCEKDPSSLSASDWRKMKGSIQDFSSESVTREIHGRHVTKDIARRKDVASKPNGNDPDRLFSERSRKSSPEELKYSIGMPNLLSQGWVWNSVAAAKDL
uniref:Uncharacterized protein n=1 Tax=Salix viminalis TaxID=40686 RepID=A0A6N2KTG7_SALVM